MTHKRELHAELFQNKPWEDNKNSIWLASTIHLHRNIEKLAFPAKLATDKQTQIISLVSKPLLQSPHIQKPTLWKSEEIGPIEKEYLVEHFLSSQSFHQTHHGEAFILDKSGTFLCTLNVHNHIQFQLIDCQGELENAWNYLVKIETDLGKTCLYAFSPKFGFLNADPSECGTGFVLKIFLQLSALVHSGRLPEVLEKTKTDDITIAGIQGNPDEIIGDIYTISNRYTLALTEENIISAVRLFITRLIVEENAMRSELHHHPDTNVMDKVSRAYGVLAHSYKIETIEALNAISLLKLGANLRWVEGVTSQQLNHLFFDCRRAHLLSKFEEPVQPEEIAHRRAEFIHKAIKNAVLKI